MVTDTHQISSSRSIQRSWQRCKSIFHVRRREAVHGTDGVNTNKYVTSFVGVAPIEDPQIVLLVTLYNPTGEGGHQGGGVAAPIGGQLFSEILPYIDAKKNEAAESEKIVEVPNIEGITIEEARKILKDSGLDINIEKDESLNEKETIIKEQLPKKGIKLKAGSKVIISY